MRNLFLGAILASTALTGGLHAQTGPYIIAEGGAVLHERTDIHDASHTFQRRDRSKVGWQAGGAVGYDFGTVSLEAEGFYDKSALRREYRPVGTPLPNGVFGNEQGFGGHTETVAAMANGLVHVTQWRGFKASVGGGLGYTRIDAWSQLAGAGGLRGHDTGLAWQALARVAVPLGDHWDVGVKYRYFRPDGAEHFLNQSGAEQRSSLRSHSLLATLTYRFGGGAASEPVTAPEPVPPPAPPPEVPPPPPPPPPPPAPTCAHTPYIVFFDWNSADITPTAVSILDSAVQAYSNCASVPVMVAGYTDSSGTRTYNQALSVRRAQAIRTYLSSHGLAGANITIQGNGEENQRVPTADGVRELQNRRVEITYGPGSGI